LQGRDNKEGQGVIIRKVLKRKNVLNKWNMEMWTAIVLGFAETV
jgi:hypothetical protein